MAARAPSRATIHLYQEPKGDWRWRLKLNGRVMADSGEGYRTRAGCLKAVGRVATLFASNPILNVTEPR
jgi:uncharacterized protein YegP (UPF0339 family)